MKKGRGKALAPGECPNRPKCQMFVEFCQKKCTEFLTCKVWGNKRKEEL